MQERKKDYQEIIGFELQSAEEVLNILGVP
jgi:hypothetical protein